MEARLSPFVYNAQGFQVAFGDPEVLYTREDDTALYARVTSQNPQLVPFGTPSDYYNAQLLIRGLPPYLGATGLHGVILHARRWVRASMTISEDRQVLTSTSVDSWIVSRLKNDFEAMVKAEAEARAKAEAEAKARAEAEAKANAEAEARARAEAQAQAQAAEQERLARLQRAQQRLAEAKASTEEKLQRVDELHAAIDSDFEVQRQLEQEIILLAHSSDPAQQASEYTKAESKPSSSVHSVRGGNIKKRKASSSVPGHAEKQRVKRESLQHAGSQPEKPRPPTATPGTDFDLFWDSEGEDEPLKNSSDAVPTAAKSAGPTAGIPPSEAPKHNGQTVRQNNSASRDEVKLGVCHSDVTQCVVRSHIPKLPAVLTDQVIAEKQGGPPPQDAKHIDNSADYTGVMDVPEQMKQIDAVQSMLDQTDQGTDGQALPDQVDKSNTLKTMPDQMCQRSVIPSVPERMAQDNVVSSTVDSQMAGIEATHNEIESVGGPRDGQDADSSLADGYERSYYYESSDHSDTSSDCCTEDGHSAYHLDSASER